jgi:hypothetical protein
MTELIEAIRSPEAGPQVLATALLRYVQASATPKEGSSWTPEAGIRVRYGVKLHFPKRTVAFKAVKGVEKAAMHRAYEYCAGLAAKLGNTHYGDAELDGPAVFDALVEAKVFETCGYNGGSIRFAGFKAAQKGTPTVPSSIDELV